MFRVVVVLFGLLAAAIRADAAPLRLHDGQAEYPLAAHFDVLEDPGATLRLEDILRSGLQQSFRPPARGAGHLNFGYSDAAFWLRLRVAAERPGEWLLEIAYPSLDRVDLYTPAAAGGYAFQHSGDRAPFAARPYPHRHLVFPVTLPAGEAVLYLRIQSAGTLTVPAFLWQREAFQRADPTLYALFALYYGTLLALGLYNLLLYFSIRDRAYLQYVLFVAGMAIGQASLNGFGNQYLWPDWPAWGGVALPAGFAIAGLFGALFTRTFLSMPRTSPRLDNALRLTVALFALALLVLPVSYRAGAMLTSLGGLGISVLAILSGLVALGRGHAGARFFLLAWTLLLVGVGVMAARNFGWLPTNFFTTYAMQIGSTLDLLLLSFALADRINMLRGEKEAAQAEALAAKQAMLEALGRHERDLEARVEARTLELEAANALLRESEQELSRMARHDPLTGLGNRVYLDEELERAIGRAGRQDTRVAVLLIDLDGFKPINDRFGHAFGDEVLRQVANRMRRAIRGSDTLARLGGDEFVIAVEGRDAARDAAAVAGKLLARLAEPIPARDAEMRLGASIGIAVYPDDGEFRDDLLRRADRAMYAAKTAGGNRHAFYAAGPDPVSGSATSR